MISVYNGVFTNTISIVLWSYIHTVYFITGPVHISTWQPKVVHQITQYLAPILRVQGIACTKQSTSYLKYCTSLSCQTPVSHISDYFVTSDSLFTSVIIIGFI